MDKENIRLIIISRVSFQLQSCPQVNFFNNRNSTNMDYIDPQLRDFIVFCLERRGHEWPAIYDEIVSVAGQRLFRGLGYDELKLLGLSLAASKAPALKQTIDYIATREKKGKKTLINQ
jgi:hypothetical protein